MSIGRMSRMIQVTYACSVCRESCVRRMASRTWSSRVLGRGSLVSPDLPSLDDRHARMAYLPGDSREHTRPWSIIAWPASGSTPSVSVTRVSACRARLAGPAFTPKPPAPPDCMGPWISQVPRGHGRWGLQNDAQASGRRRLGTPVCPAAMTLNIVKDNIPACAMMPPHGQINPLGRGLISTPTVDVSDGLYRLMSI
jgi:ribosomal protein L37AE/L43A